MGKDAGSQPGDHHGGAGPADGHPTDADQRCHPWQEHWKQVHNPDYPEAGWE